MKFQIAPISATKSHDLFASFVDALRASKGRSFVRAGFAYATLGGAKTLVSHAESVDNWADADKAFLIGIHQAITEPSALDFLRDVTNSEVRAFVPGSKLRVEAFDATPVFHAKVLAVSTAGSRNMRLLQAGSTNLTSSAIANRPKNYEFSLAIQATVAASLDSEKLFNTWWSHLWAQSRRVDKQFIQKYAELRRQVLDRNPILRSAAEPPSGIGEAEYFFSEVGAASGPPGARHQIEFPESLARFFGGIKRQRRNISLRRGNRTWTGRPLSYKKTTYGVEIWRLGMPTQPTGGDPIAERAIRFRRTPSHGAFEFEVVDVGSQEFDEWVRLANRHGHLGATHGERARRYGFY